jgi:mRNA-degrading endonuclease toxin of MazEF toxin-antitoxin module
VKFGRGAVVVVELDPTLGHEQQDTRPCVVVSDPDIISDRRFPLVWVVPAASSWEGHRARGTCILCSRPVRAASRRSRSR